MDRYQRVEKPKAGTPIDENEIRITSQGRMRNYITYAMSLLQEKGSEEIVFKAMGRAINKTVTMVELIKRRIVGLHQNTSIGSTDITDTWEPLEEGLLPLETTRHVSMIVITLSKKELNASSVGYQSPLPADQVKAFDEFEYDGEGSPSGRGRGRGGRGRGRGGRGRGRGRARGNGFMNAEYEEENWEGNRGHGTNQGRGGRNFHGRGRENDGPQPQFDRQQDVEGGGHYHERPHRGGGRYNNRTQYDRQQHEEVSYDRTGGYNSNGPRFDRQQQYDEGHYNQEAPVRRRGGYNGPRPQFDRQQDGGGYNQEAPVRRRGGYNNGPKYGNTQRDETFGRRRGGFNNGPGPQFERQRDEGGHYNQDAPGRRRGGYNGPPPQFDGQQDEEGYNQNAPRRGRGGRGRGNRGGRFNEPMDG